MINAGMREGGGTDGDKGGMKEEELTELAGQLKTCPSSLLLLLSDF